jgi:predicted PurR-regulated permease PerM
MPSDDALPEIDRPTGVAAPAPATALDTSGEDLVPGWLARLAAIAWRILVAVALVVLGGLVLLELSIVTGAILVALIVTAVVYPLVQQLRDRGWPRARAAGAVSVLALLVVVTTIVLIAVAFIPYVADVIRSVSEGVTRLSRLLAAAGVSDAVLRLTDQAVADLQAWLIEGISAVVAPIADFVTILILGGFLTFYLLEDGDRAWTSATRNLDDWRAEQLTGRGAIALEQVGGYLRGTAVLAVTDAVTDWIFLMLLGVPFAGPLAVIVFIGGFVPYLGSIVTIGILALVTLAAQGPLAAAALLGLILLTNVVQNRYLAPRAFGASARVPAALAVIALVFGTALFGVMGLFVVVPVVAMVSAFAPAVVGTLGSIKQRPSSTALVPLWLDRLGQWSWRLLVVLALGWLLIQVLVAPFFTAPVVLAMILGSALAPLVEQLYRRGLSRTMAVLAVTGATIAIVAVVLFVTIASLANSMDEIVGTATAGAGRLGLGSTPGDVVRAFGGGIASTVTSIASEALRTTLVLAISVLLIFFFLRDAKMWWSYVLVRVPANRRDRINEVGVQSVDILRGTMTGTAIASFAGAVLQWITMVVLGLPLALPLSVLMFFAGFIPYIGSFIVTAMSFLVAVAVGDPIDVALMAVFTIVFNLVQGNIVAPLVFGKTVSIHPAVVLLAAPAGAAIGGVLGMVMMVPVLAIINRTWRIILHLFDPEHQQPPAPAPAPPSVAPAVGLAGAPLEGPAVEGA